MKYFYIIFALAVVFNSTVYAQMQWDESDKVWAIVVPEAESHDIDMGEVLYTQYKDSIIVDLISNIGDWDFKVDSIYFTGDDSDCFELRAGLPVYTVKKGQKQFGEIRFHPDHEGDHSANIIIQTQFSVLEQKITGNCVMPNVIAKAKEIDFGKVNITEHKDSLKAVTVVNIGNRTVFIDSIVNIGPHINEFEILSDDKNIELTRDETCKLDLRFEPSSKALFNTILNFYFKGYGSPVQVMLFGEGVNRYPVINAYYSGFPDLICENEDSVEIFIANSGDSTLNIHKLSLTGPDYKRYEAHASCPVTVDCDSVFSFFVSINTETPGMMSALLEINSNAKPDSIFILPLLTRKDSIEMIPDKSIIDIGHLCPGQIKEIELSVINNSTISCGGYSVTTGNLVADSPKFSLPSGQVHSLDLHYKAGNDYGLFSENITVYDSICGYSRPVNITGYISRHEIDIDDIDLGYVCPGSIIDTFITIYNVGPMDFIGEASNDELLSDGTARFVTAASAHTDIDMQLSAPVDEGQYKDTIIVTDSICGYYSEVTLDYEVLYPSISGENVDIGCALGSQKTQDIEIVNNSEYPCTIISVTGLSGIFEIVNPTLPVELQPGKATSFNILYTPDDLLPDSQSLLLTLLPCDYTENIEISGSPANADATIMVPDVAAYPGDLVEVPIILSNSEFLEYSGAKYLAVKLSYNNTLLSPIGYTQSSNADISTIEISGLPAISAMGDSLAVIRFVAGLGKAPDCQLRLFDAQTDTAGLSIATENGSFTLKGICTDGGPRLINPNSAIEFKTIAPNPVSGDIVLEFSLSEISPATVIITDMLGRKVRSIRIDSGPGEKLLTLKSGSLAPGQYLVKLQTSTTEHVQLLLIE